MSSKTVRCGWRSDGVASLGKEGRGGEGQGRRMGYLREEKRMEDQPRRKGWEIGRRGGNGGG